LLARQAVPRHALAVSPAAARNRVGIVSRVNCGTRNGHSDTREHKYCLRHEKISFE
jgi:hypothetical protein